MMFIRNIYADLLILQNDPLSGYDKTHRELMSACESTAFVLGFVWWKYWKMKTYFRLTDYCVSGQEDAETDAEEERRYTNIGRVIIYKYFNIFNSFKIDIWLGLFT